MRNRINERRKNYFIRMKFQRAFILKFCLLVAAGTILSGLMVYRLSTQTVTTTFENSRLQIKSTSDFILPALILSSCVVIVAIGIATIIVTLITSHRIAGPLYRLEQDMQKVLAGDLTVKFTLRSHDELQSLGQSLNALLQTFRTDIDSLKKSVSGMSQLLDAGERHKTEGHETLRSIENNLKAALDKFRT
jgi:methyl-accepting chemotaxis protein